MNKDSIVMTSRQILLYLADISIGYFSIFDRHRMYRKNIKDYWRWREMDRKCFSQRIYHLKKRNLIRIYVDDKETYVELTPKGAEKIRKFTMDEMTIKKPKVWDKKWRLVIFDIPNDEKVVRDILREHLKRLGFIKFQESVFVYPFECKKEIDYLAETYAVKRYLKYILADIMEGDQDLIEVFLDEGVITPKMIKTQHK